MKNTTRKRKGTKEEQEQRDRFVKLRSMLRRAWMLDPERLATLINARRAYKGVNVRQKWEYMCATCSQDKKWHMLKEVVVDHILPCGSFLGPEDFATFVPNLFCNRDNLQVLCKECHKIKTAKERVKNE